MTNRVAGYITRFDDITASGSLSWFMENLGG